MCVCTLLIEISMLVSVQYIYIIYMHLCTCIGSHMYICFPTCICSMYLCIPGQVHMYGLIFNLVLFTGHSCSKVVLLALWNSFPSASVIHCFLGLELVSTCFSH